MPRLFTHMHWAQVIKVPENASIEPLLATATKFSMLSGVYNFDRCIVNLYQISNAAFSSNRVII